MNRAGIGAVLLLALLMGGLFFGHQLEAMQLPIAAEVEAAQRYAQAGNYPEAARAAAEAERAWYAGRTFTACLVDHRPMEEIEALFAGLRAYGEQKPRQYIATCAQLALRLRTLAESQRLNISSFF